MFCWLRFKFVFYRNLWPFWGHVGLHLALFLRKNHVEKRFKKRRLPTWKRVTMWMSRGSQRRRLLLFFIKAAASRARCLDNNNNKVKLNSIQFNSIQIELRSGWDLAEVWLRSGLSSNCCLSWLRLQKKTKIIRTIGKVWGQWKWSMSKFQKHITHDLITPTGPRPGEF